MTFRNAIFFVLATVLFTGFAHAQSVPSQSPWWVKTGAITQLTPNYPIRLTGLTPGGCLQLTSQNIATTTGAPCSSGGSGSTGLATTSPWTIGNLAQVVDNGHVTSIATSSLGLTVSSFASPNISQWTNNSGYLTAAITALGAQYSTAQTAATQTIASSTTGTDFSITSSLNTTTFNLPTASGSNRGLLSSADWTTFNGKQAAGNYITALTGDLTASGPGSVAGTLATVNGNVGSFTNASITVNGKGLITAASSGASSGITALGSGWATTTATAITFSTTTQSFNGLTFAEKISVPNTGALLFTPNISGTLDNTGLSNSSITVNSTSIALGASGTITAASSTLLANNNTWTGVNIFGNASTTQLGVSGDSWFKTASSLLYTDSAKKVNYATIGASSTVAVSDGTLVKFNKLATSQLTNDSGFLTSAGAVTSIAQNGGGTAQVGVITLATSSNTTNGITSKLMITNSSGTFTFSSDQTGTLTVPGGGTGAATLTGVLLGNGTSAFTAASTQTCTNQFMRAMSSTYSGTCAAVSLTADVTGTLGVGNGGTGQTTFTSSNLLYGVGGGALQSVATSTTGTASTVAFLDANQHIVIPHASTTDMTFSSFLVGTRSGVTGALSPIHPISLGVPTSTTWTASTTGSGYSPWVAAPFAGTLQSAQCIPLVGASAGSFLGVNTVVNGSNATPSYFVASSTVGTITFSAGNTFTKGQILLLNFGTTTTATATSISCTLLVTETP